MTASGTGPQSPPMRTIPPLGDCPRAAWLPLSGVLTDIDDTLTSDGAIAPAALDALHRLQAAGVPVIAITGRPAGWSEPFAEVSVRRTGGAAEEDLKRVVLCESSGDCSPSGGSAHLPVIARAWGPHPARSSWSMSARGGVPNSRRYSRLNCDALS